MSNVINMVKPKRWEVTLGLGRLANNHPRTYLIMADTEGQAIVTAKFDYRQDVEAEIGKNDPIWNKTLNVASINQWKSL